MSAGAAGCLLSATVGWSITNVGAIAGELAQAYGSSLGAIGALTGGMFLAHLLVQIPAGRLADRRGARTVALASAAIMLLASLAALVAPSYPLALTARVATGVGTGMGIIAGSAYVRAMGGGSLGQALYGAVGSSAPGLALVGVALLEPALGWRTPFATAAAMALLVLGALAASPADHPRHAGAAPLVARLRTLVGDPRLRRLATLHAASFGLAVVVGNWMVEYLELAGRATPAAAAVGGVLVFAMAPGRLLGGWLRLRRPRSLRGPLAASLVLSGAGVAILAADPPLAVALAVAAIAGLGSGVPFATAFVEAAETRDDAPATALAVVNGSSSLVIVLGTPALGLAFGSLAGAQTGLTVVAALWALSALALVPWRRD